MNYKITEKDTIIIKSFNLFLEENKPTIPNCQREFIEERIEYFYETIKKYCQSSNYKKEYPVPFLNMIYCGKYENKIYILDGQHRFKAYLKYYNETKMNFNVVLNIKDCETESEIKEYFRELNNNFILHDIILEEELLDKTIVIKNYIKEKYSRHISNSSNPRYPNINLDELCNYFLGIYPNKDCNEIIFIIEQLNEDKSNELKINNTILYEQGHKKQGFYLGYLFIKQPDKTRKKLPSSVRNSLWKNNFGNYKEGKCYVCKTYIDDANFHAGHIQSVFSGGTDNLDNLVPVCQSCNLSMGIQNLEEFKTKYF